MRTLVTGGAGFIGSHLAARLVAEGHDVVVLDDLSTGRRENLASVSDRLRFVEGDLRDEALVGGLVRGVEVVFHQGALASVERSLEEPEAVASVNVGGTINVLRAAQREGVRRVVFASSSSVYGDAAELPKHEALPLRPRSPYAATKAGAEAFLLAFQSAFGLEAAILRYFNVYGPRQAPEARHAAVVPAFVAACLAGRPLVIQGDGQQTRDFTYVDDVVEAALLAASAPRAVEGPLNVGGGRRTTVLALARAVGQACGLQPDVRHVPPRAGDVRDSQAAVVLARERLGWLARISLDEGIARTVEALCNRDSPMEARP